MVTKEKDLEWENRVLCSDESCIGVIGPDGRCKECGLSYEGELPASIDLNAPVTTQTDEAAPEEEVKAEDPTQEDVDDEWDRRTLCIDESCIGVVGPDGLCKECGKPYQR